jgi:hypothetical protein
LFKFARGWNGGKGPVAAELVCARRANSGTRGTPPRTSAPDADKGRDILLSSGFSSPFFGAARVTDSSVYHLASALNGRGVGRMTPRSSVILPRAHILLPGGGLRRYVMNLSE